MFRQEPTTGERVGGALGAIGGAAAVTAAESPELIPVVAPITAKAGAMAGRAVEERLLRKQSSDGNPTPESCWDNGFYTGYAYADISDRLSDIRKQKVVPSKAVKDDINDYIHSLVSGIMSKCVRWNIDRVKEAEDRFREAVDKEDWTTARIALTDIFIEITGVGKLPE